MPPILYGTAWKKEQTTALVVQAVLAGFTGIDTAAQPKHYSQALVGDALKILKAEHGVERETLWLQTKFTGLAGQDLTKPIPYDKDAALDIQVRQSLEASLAELSTTYLDSLIMHSPMKTRAETAVVWREFEKFVESGKVRYLGISNVSTQDLEWMFQTFTIKPFIVQNPFTDRDQFSLLTLSLCEIYGAKFQSFWTLAIKPSLLRSSGPPTSARSPRSIPRSRRSSCSSQRLSGSGITRSFP